MFVDHCIVDFTGLAIIFIFWQNDAAAELRLKLFEVFLFDHLTILFKKEMPPFFKGRH